MTRSRFPDHISDRVFSLCNSSETVSSLLAKDPSLTPADAWNQLFGQHALKKKRHLSPGEEEEGSSSSEEDEENERDKEEYSISDNEGENLGNHVQGTTGYYKSLPTPPHSPTSAEAQEQLERAAKCGNWGAGNKRPSDLFLQIYHDALCTLDDDPLRGMVSPPLLGTCGTVPLTIISV